MRDLFKAYRVEIIVGFISTAICLFFVVPVTMEKFRAWSSEKGGEATVVREEVPVGPGTIYARTTHEPLFTGETPRDAIEKRVAAIRDLFRVQGIDPLPMSYRELEVSLKQSWAAGDAAPLAFFRSMDRADFRGLKLQNIDLRGMSLRGCIFNGADLSGAQLSGAIFRYANMSGINLSNTDLRESALRWPIEGGRFRGSNFENERVGSCWGCDFSGANLRNAHIQISGNSDTVFFGADMRGATLEVLEHKVFLSHDQNSDQYRKVRIEPPSVCYRRIQFDETTQTEGLHFTGVVDSTAPFVLWALAHEAILSEDTE